MSNSINTQTNIPRIPPKVWIGTKQWIYELCDLRIANIHEHARYLANVLVTWLEYISLQEFQFSVPFNSINIQLFGALLLDILLERENELRKKCPTENLIRFINTGFPLESIYKLKGEIECLDFFNMVKIKTLVEQLEKLLTIIPQTLKIRNLSLILLDVYILQFFSIVEDRPKVAAACVSMARFWILEDEKLRWPDEYVKQTGIECDDFKDEYEKTYCIAYLINKKNLEKKKLEADELKRRLTAGGLPSTLNQ
jgi:hypothetical protein